MNNNCNKMTIFNTKDNYNKTKTITEKSFKFY